MEKNRSIKLYIMFALIISVVGLSIAYAAFSSTLTIEGLVTVKKTTDAWNIGIEALDGTTNLTPTITGSAKEITSPTISGTTISGFEINFYAPGDIVAYDFNLVNNGKVNAVLEEQNINVGTLTCTPKANGTATTAEAIDLCNDLYTNLVETKTIIGEKQVLAPGEKRTFRFEISWNEESTAVISDDVVVKLDGMTMPITQE